MDKVIYRLEIPMRLPSLNDYIRDCRGNKFKGATTKKDVESDLAFYICRLPLFEKPIKVHFHWVEQNKRRDLDNVAFAKKFILDTMVKEGRLKDDNRRYVTGFTDSFSYAKESKVILEIEAEENDGA